MNREILVAKLGLLVIATLVIVEILRVIPALRVLKRITRATQKFELRNPRASRRILCVGDSTLYGVGTTDKRYSIVGRLSADMPDAHIENDSRSGSYALRAFRVLRSRAASDCATFDVVILMVGGMDLVTCVPLWFVRAVLRRAVRYSKQCGRETVLISPANTGLAPLYRFPLAQLYQWRAKRFRDLYTQIAREEHIHLTTLFQENSDELSRRGLFASDKNHPSDEGYAVWYDQMKDTIAKSLEPV